MKHIFKQSSKQNAPVLLLLHGTGGTEEDLLEVAKLIDEEASVLSVRGNVSENGMPRFSVGWQKVYLMKKTCCSVPESCMSLLTKARKNMNLTAAT